MVTIKNKVGVKSSLANSGGANSFNPAEMTEKTVLQNVHFVSAFLGATKHLYNWLCPLVGRSVGWSVGNAFLRRSTRRILLAYLALFFRF